MLLNWSYTIEVQFVGFVTFICSNNTLMGYGEQHIPRTMYEQKLGRMYLYVTRMYLFVTRMYLYVTRMYLYVTHMYLYVTRM